MSPTVLNHLACTPVLLEGLMLTCFGLAWPMANLRMLRTGRAEGKGLTFTLIILLGYLAGASAKIALISPTMPLEPVFWLYVLNSVSVAANLGLQWRYGRRPQSLAATPTVNPQRA